MRAADEVTLGRRSDAARRRRALRGGGRGELSRRAVRGVFLRPAGRGLAAGLGRGGLRALGRRRRGRRLPGRAARPEQRRGARSDEGGQGDAGGTEGHGVKTPSRSRGWAKIRAPCTETSGAATRGRSRAHRA